MILLAPKYTKLVVGTLDLIREELDRLYRNKYHQQMNSPFDNLGEKYSNDTFAVKGYEYINVVPNFIYKDIFKVYWHKRPEQGINAYYDENYNFDINFLADMVNNCFKAMRKDFGENYAD